MSSTENVRISDGPIQNEIESMPDTIYKNNESESKKMNSRSSSSSSIASDTEEPPTKKLVSSPSKNDKDSNERSHKDSEKHRLRTDDKHRSSSRRHHHKSSSHRHKSNERHRDDSKSFKHKKSSSHKEHRSGRSSHRHRDSSRDRTHSDRYRHKKRSSSNSSSNSSLESHRKNERDSSRNQKHYRRDQSGSRDKKKSYDRDHRKNQSSRRDDWHKKNETVKTNPADLVKPEVSEALKKANAAAAAAVTSIQTQEGSPNVAEMLKSIIIPPELRHNPAEASKYQMEQLRLKTEQLTGVKVPTFYNATAVNPLLYAEQQKKRKLLWSKAKDNGTTTTSLVGRAIVEGKDEKTSEKFRKLMGIKTIDDTNEQSTINNTVQMNMMQQKAFEVMDKEYEYARMTTHTHRGQGLGFATTGLIDPNKPQ